MVTCYIYINVILYFFLEYFLIIFMCITIFIVAFSFLYHICTIKLFKIKMFNIEEYLPELNDIDLSILKNELPKYFHWRGEFICLKDTLIVSNKKKCYCILLHDIENLGMYFNHGNIEYITYIYKQNNDNQNPDKIGILIRAPLYNKFFSPNGVNLDKIIKNNELFKEKLIK